MDMPKNKKELKIDFSGSLTSLEKQSDKEFVDIQNIGGDLVLNFMRALTDYREFKAELV